jgi:(p)ppGpp synthase/HD superfamily hydrolase
LILGFAARGSVNVHRADCETARHVDTETPGRVVKVYWVQSGHHVETIRITVQARAGILTELAGSISGAGGTLLDTTPHGAEMLLQIETDQRHQARVRQAIGLLEGVKVVK